MNKYYIRVLELITQYYEYDEDKAGTYRLGQYVINNLEDDLASKMYPMINGLATDTFIFYETNNVIAARSLMDTAAAMEE